MKIYKDLITGDGMFADTYKMKLVDDVIYEVYGRLVCRSEGDIQIEGFDPPDQVEVFKTNINRTMKEILGRFKDLQFFTGESMDCDGMVAMYIA